MDKSFITDKGDIMMKYILYGHDGSGNHGCEALVRSTIGILGSDRQRTVLISRSPEEDSYYGIDKICKIVERESKGSPSKKTLSFWKAYFALKTRGDYLPLDMLAEARAATAERGDIALAIGGDTYCYGSTDRQARYHDVWKYNGLKTVYWGCSIEPELLKDKEIVKDIQSFDLITARETISYQALKQVNPNTILVSDSAFLLKTKPVLLPASYCDSKLIGINSSPLIEKNESIKGIARKNYQRLIEYLLQETNYKILLIPHVIWKDLDDRDVLKTFYNRYKSTGRIYMVEDCTCEELKGYISKCSLFVGARTHATIAAYSNNIPTLVVGYSVKARGIAKDLFGQEERYVLPVQSMQTMDDLKNDFIWMENHESEIRLHLEKIMPEYSKRSLQGAEAVKKLM